MGSGRVPVVGVGVVEVVGLGEGEGRGGMVGAGEERLGGWMMLGGRSVGAVGEITCSRLLSPETREPGGGRMEFGEA